MLYQEIQPAELARRMSEENGTFLLIDVREPLEHEIARIEGARLLPLSRFQEWAGRLRPEQEIVFMCHHGIRSAQVCTFFSRQGFTKLHNLEGGIDAWSREVDPDVPLY
jgi:rhodanese-related sulfurtransferase